MVASRKWRTEEHKLLIASLRILKESAAANELWATIEPLFADEKPGTVLLDPFAEGVGERVTGCIAVHPVDRLIYVSCNPTTQ
jgi:tRNA/tmRNA/rRNA uracil-C5-methylase (TrmA/RlmC/RlmD family)